MNCNLKEARILLALSLLLIYAATVSAQSQAEMNRQSCDQYARADAELNKIYEQVLSKRIEAINEIFHVKNFSKIFNQFIIVKLKRSRN
jgi:uncharacterized protein YecT (DUF1311 family)